ARRTALCPSPAHDDGLVEHARRGQQDLDHAQSGGHRAGAVGDDRGDRYASRSPCCWSITQRSGSVAPDTSALGRPRPTMRSATPVLFVSSVSYTARTLMPLAFSKSFSTGSEKT